MKQTRKGGTWYFGMKVHAGTDKRGLTHSLTVTNATQADIKQMPALLHGEEREVYGDQASWKEADRQDFEARKVRYRVNRRPNVRAPLTEQWKKINRSRSRVRARGEHAFHVVKRLWGFTKVRYRGLAKNRARTYIMFALANLYMVRRKLIPPGVTCAL